MRSVTAALLGSISLLAVACSPSDSPKPAAQPAVAPPSAPAAAPAPVPAPSPAPATNPSLTPEGQPIEAALTCREEIGEPAAQKLVQRCIQVSPATRPPCNVANPCQMIQDEIKRGCDFFGPDEKPAECTA